MAAEIKSIDVAQLIDSRPAGRFQLMVFVLAASVMLLDGANSLAIGLAAPSIAHTLGLPARALGSIFGYGQAGVMLGALCLGSLADRVGRKAMVIGCVAAFAIFTLLIPLCRTQLELQIVRLLTGVGLGGATPNVVALASEYARRKTRSAVVAALWAAFPLGGTVVGLLSAWVLSNYGWQMLFVVTGAISVALCPLLLLGLPESLYFLVLNGASESRIRSIVTRIDRSSAALPLVSRKSSSSVTVRASLAALFRQGRAAGTLLLWAGFFSSFLVLLFVSSWIPSLLRAHDFSTAQAGLAISLNSFGSLVGAVAIGGIMDKAGAYRALVWTCLLSAGFTALLGGTTGSFELLAAVITIAGCVSSAAQAGIIALAATLYPTGLRGTGLGWSIASGRLGAIVGPVMGGDMIAQNWSAQHMLLAVGAIALGGAFAVLLLSAAADAAGWNDTDPLTI